MTIRLLLTLCFLSLAARSQEHQHFSGPEAVVHDLISALPEVKADNHVYDSITHRVQQVKMILDPPDTATGLYRVKVGYQGSGRFEPHYYFYVNPDSRQIYVEDMEYGDRPTLSEWRARRDGSRSAPRTDTGTSLPDSLRARPVNVY